MQLMYSILWAALTVVLIGVEFVTVALVSIWFALGAIGAFITSFITDSFAIQIAVFIIISIIMLLATRPLVRKFMSTKKDVPTNSDRLVGKICILSKPITQDNQEGMTEIDGIFWIVKPETPGIDYEMHEKVRIVQISGSKLIITKVS